MTMPTEPTDAERATARKWLTAYFGEDHARYLCDEAFEGMGADVSLATALATARAEGWRAAMEAAAQACDTIAQAVMVNDDVQYRNGALMCRETIRALAGPGEREGT